MADPLPTEVAKDPNVPMGTRARAAKDAMGDKMDEHRHGVRGKSYYWIVVVKRIH